MASTKKQLLESDIHYYGSSTSSTTGPSTAAAGGSASTSATAATHAESTPEEKQEPYSVVVDPVNPTTIKKEEEKKEEEVKPAVTSDVTEEDYEDLKPFVHAKSDSEEDEARDEDFKPVFDVKSDSEEEETRDEDGDEKMDDDLPGRDLWKLKRKTEKVRNDIYYREAHVHRKDGSRQKFKVGDCVWMVAEGGDIWVGLILDFYYDSKASKYNVLLRWFYNEEHLKVVENVKVQSIVQIPYLKHELFFSDDLEFASNEVNVIEGKVHLFQTKSEYEQFESEEYDPNADEDEDEDDYPGGNGSNERKYLVRNFYKPLEPESSNPPRLRVLEPGELNYLLNHPEVKPMWYRFAKAGSARNTYTGKGTGRDSVFQPTSKIRKSSSKEVRKGRKKLRRLPDSMQVDEEEAPPKERTGQRQLSVKELMFKRD